MIFDEEDYEQELIYLKTAARGCSQRENLRFGLVTNTKLIKQLKMTMGSLWFTEDKVAYSTSIVKRWDDQTFKIDLLATPTAVQLQWYISKKSIPLVPLASEEAIMIARMTGQPRIVAYVSLPED